MAAKGYPGTPKKGGAISARLDQKGATIFQAGTARKGGGLVADGGRVLGVAARGKTVAEAQRAAYRAVDRIEFPDRLLPARHRLARNRAPQGERRRVKAAGQRYELARSSCRAGQTTAMMESPMTRARNSRPASNS